MQNQRVQKTVAVVGLGYVGLPLALLLERRGCSVIGIDADVHKVSELRNGHASFLSDDERQQLVKSNLTVDEAPNRISSADIVIVCVPTPVNGDFSPDLRSLQAASRAIGTHLSKGTLVIVESTVNPGACEETVLPILAKESGLIPDKDFYFAHCPERINPGDTVWTLARIPRVIGANTPESRAAAIEFYQTTLGVPVHPVTTIREAEAVKVVENAFRDINIAFVNELAMSFQKLGINVKNVITAAASKPFAFMAHYPGCGVGGHCIPVDPYYLIDYAKRHGFTHRLVKVARDINNGMPRYTIGLLEKELARQNQSLKGVRVALLGLAYKGGVPDLRESPALVIYKELVRKGAHVQAYDPYVRTEHIPLAQSLEEVLSNVDAVVLGTNHYEFHALSPDHLLRNNIRILIDGRNALSEESFVKAGIRYRGIGI